MLAKTELKKGYTLIADTKKTSYSDNTVVPGRKYYYRIRAYARSRYNDIVYSPYSQVKNQTLKPEKAQIHSLKKKSSKTYLLSWRKVPGADGYEVFRQISGKKWKLETNVYDYLPQNACAVISTETLGMAFEPEQKYENPDGTPIVFRYDYFGNRQGIHPLPGPFASKEAAEEALS